MSKDAPVVMTEAREAFEAQIDQTKLAFRKGGGVFAEHVPESEYVDSGMQKQWEFWQKAWSAALAAHPPQVVPPLLSDADLSPDLIFRLADEDAQESLENGDRIFDRAGLLQFTKALRAQFIKEQA